MTLRRVCAGLVLSLIAAGCDFSRPITPGRSGFGTMPTASPIFGRTVEAERTPPPISGGTLVITADGTRAVAADPDRDAVWIVSLAEGTSQRISFSPGDEPGRVALDGAGRAHVALRGGGALAVIDVANAQLIERRPTCAAPRGVAYQSTGNVIHVACVSGQLVSLDAATGARVRTLQLDDDLRDIVVTPTGLLVSRFRSAEVLAIDAEGRVVSRGAAPTMDEPIRPVVRPDGTRFTPTENRSVPRVAWRLASSTGGGVVMLHQRAVTGPLLPSAAAEYYDNAANCRASVAQSAVTTFSGSNAVGGVQLGRVALAVDVAVSQVGRVAVIAPGDARLPGGKQVFLASLSASGFSRASCVEANTGESYAVPGQATAGAWLGNELVVQLREPAALVFAQSQRVITLPGESREDTGHQIFHANTGIGVACASCHAEGGDDGHAWNFGDETGRRRTQTFRGGLLGTEPFHWGGELRDVTELMGDTFNTRMRGPSLSSSQINALARWMDRIPKPTRLRAMDASAERGQALFHDPTVACATCHGGRLGTNAQTIDVGTGMALQVPSLAGLAWRAPYMHDGCAPTLRARFTDPRCGGGDRHGRTTQLSSAQIDDLVAYMQTL